MFVEVLLRPKCPLHSFSGTMRLIEDHLRLFVEFSPNFWLFEVFFVVASWRKSGFQV